MNKTLSTLPLLALAIACEDIDIIEVDPIEQTPVEIIEVEVLSPCADGVTFDHMRHGTALDQETEIYSLDIFATVCAPVTYKSVEYSFTITSLGDDNWGRMHEASGYFESEKSQAFGERLVAPDGQQFVHVEGSYTICDYFTEQCSNVEVDIELGITSL